MDHKPIKRNVNLVPVSREHHSTLLFCWKLREGVKHKVDSERIVKYIDWFWADHILPHFETEEKLLFTDTEDPKVKQALSEHRQIEYLVKEMSEQRPGAAPELILKLSELVNQHVRYEERDLFPYLEQNFGEAKLAEIGKILHSEEHNASEVYNDEFWVKEK